MEVVDNCSVWIKGVVIERYFVMGINGIFVSQVRIFDEKYYFFFRFGSDLIWNYCLLINLVMVFLLCNQIQLLKYYLLNNFFLCDYLYLSCYE